jgi:hypothetical protein
MTMTAKGYESLGEDRSTLSAAGDEPWTVRAARQHRGLWADQRELAHLHCGTHRCPVPWRRRPLVQPVPWRRRPLVQPVPWRRRPLVQPVPRVSPTAGDAKGRRYLCPKKMVTRTAATMPVGERWRYEPKVDGALN